MKISTSPKYNVLLAIIFLLSLPVSLLAVDTSYYFYVQFTDKNNTPYSLTNPSEFLSARAITRRTTFGLTCDSTDLPVNPSYVQQIGNLGISVHNRSKWMNGVTVLLTDSGKMSQVRALPFVKFVEYTGLLVGPAMAPPAKVRTQSNLDYGTAATQINQLNGTTLHNEGYLGEGMQIGVIDAGFSNVDINHAFDSLRLQGRLLGTKDFINPNSNIYSEDIHGAMVLATMTGNIPGQFLGTAPKASYWLIRTEYAPTEYKVETDFWCSGIEYADSVGVDLVNSSLGYYTFDAPGMGFTYADMNGKVSRASQAANLASKKGIVVVVAAGNEGNKAWHYIGSPADADGIIAVGAVTSTGIPSTFTSFGPSSDGRVKPEICAMGTSAAVVNTAGTPTTNNGTSFASPIMCGMMACLLQRYKQHDSNPNIEVLLNSVFKSASLFNNPTDLMGYGIPDFGQAESNLTVFDSLYRIEKNSFTLTYNSTYKTLIIKLPDGNIPSNLTINVYSITGTLIKQLPVNESSTVLRTTNFTPGIYAVCLIENGISRTRKVLIR
ncbi:MAG: S8 family serine peptidase [Paludibacter sp.]